MSRYFSGIILGIFLICVGSTYYWLMHQEQHFRLKTIQVASNYQMVSKAEIEQLVAPLVNTTFFRVQLGKITQALQALPGLQKIVVERRWPNDIAIKLTERRAIAQWPNHVLMDDDGHFFTSDILNSTQKLPLFTGDKTQATKIWSTYTSLSAELKPLGLTITALNYDGAEAWSVTLHNGLQVFFSDDHLQREITTFVEAYPELIAQNPKKKLLYLNMRYPHGFAAKWG